MFHTEYYRSVGMQCTGTGRAAMPQQHNKHSKVIIVMTSTFQQDADGILPNMMMTAHFQNILNQIKWTEGENQEQSWYQETKKQ